jgi:DNA-binding Lrp family transcriptional regulator
MNRQKTSFALTEEAKRLLAAISEKLGISQAAVLELLIRKEAKEQEVK